MERRSSKEKKAEVKDEPRKKVKSEVSQAHQLLQNYAHLMRIDSINSVNVTKTGHPTSCSSIAELMAVLFFSDCGMDYDAADHARFDKDRLVLSKGHAAPILYSALAWAGMLPEEALLTLRLKGSLLEGHPVPHIPFVDVATGSLGQGLGVAAGMAYSSKYFDKLGNRFWTILGDAENMEGSVWEAAAFASYYKLDNMIAFLDCNRLGQSQPTSLEHKVDVYKARWSSFGWNVYVIDGHNIVQIEQAIKKAKKHSGQPTIIIAKTFKGKYFVGIEDKLNFHGTAVSAEVIGPIRELIKGKVPEHKKYVKPEPIAVQKPAKTATVKLGYKPDTLISTRKAYGNALAALAQTDSSIVGLDGDVKNSTFAITLLNSRPHQFIECFVAEQNMISVGTGVACRNKTAFVSTFAAFFSRAADQIRILGISQKNVKIVGSHAGVSIGEDGPSQMALEDLAFFRTIPNIHIFYPSDGVSCERAVELANNHQGIDYIRTSRMDTSIIYPPDQKFQVGKSKVVVKSEHDKLVLVSGGVTLHECLAVAKQLREQSVHVRVVDIFSIKPVDQEGLLAAARASNNLVLTVEEHYREGGIFELVASALCSAGVRVSGLFVTRVPSSATPRQQLQLHGLDRASIKSKVQQLTK